MKILFVATAVVALSFSAYAAENVLIENTAKALEAGDSAAVLKALEKQVGRNNVIAAQKLGIMFRDGDVVAKDPVQARKYLKLAAEADPIRFYYKLGLTEAQFALAEMLRDGAGGPANAAAAISWFEEAADQGYGQAQLAAAHMYMNGAGITRSAERAFFWSSIAAHRLNGTALQQDAEKLRDLAQKQLEPRQLARARILVDDWKPKAS